MNRFIPATMATQHPDNASAPYWEKNGDGYISTREETEECFSAFSDLNCQEFMWDWEGKYVDEAVVDRLFHTYYDYFKINQLGRDKFLTFRIPNIKHEAGYSLARSLMGILTAESFARDLGFHTPPLFEVILPMADKAANILHIQDTFSKLAIFKQKLFKDKSEFDYLRVLPLFEGVNNLLNCGRVLGQYVRLHQRRYGRKPEYVRPHIARSDPALNFGIVPAVVAGKIALSEQYRFGEKNKIKIFPAIGVGTLPFRGGLSPQRIPDFFKEYGGIKTVYIQSAFRYDFSLAQVKAAIKKLNTGLQKTIAPIFGREEIKQAKIICQEFSVPYRRTVESLAGTINDLSSQVPSRRERKLHIGLFGYSRGIGKKKLPRAIPFTAVLYSLGVPPELIGTGRGLFAIAKSNLAVEKFYKNFCSDLILAGRFLNKENLELLARQSRAWQAVQKDVEFIEDYLGEKLGPLFDDDFIHCNLTSTALRRHRQGKSIESEMIESGKLRRSLG